MKAITMDQLHEEAMELSDLADAAKRGGNTTQSADLYNRASQLEARAADIVEQDLSAEPTRSVLYRSAAAMAIDAGNTPEAQRLIHKALSGFPPQEIEQELLGLLDNISFERHLATRNISLRPQELQFAIDGSAVGSGITQTNVFLTRLKNVEKMLLRTVERKLDIPFRKQGSPKTSILDGFSVYMTEPRAGSFAVTLRIGIQSFLPGFDISSSVISELVEGISMVENADQEGLERLIPDDTYRENFIGLARLVAPDGDKVKFVGLTAEVDGKEIQVAVRRPAKEIKLLAIDAIIDPADTETGAVLLTGQLLLADNRPRKRHGIGEIHVIADDGAEYAIKVSDGLADIVRSLYDENVTVTCGRKGKSLYLRDIQLA